MLTNVNRFLALDVDPEITTDWYTSNFYFFYKIQDGRHNGDPIIFIFESVQLLTHTNVQ